MKHGMRQDRKTIRDKREVKKEIKEGKTRKKRLEQLTSDLCPLKEG